MRYIQNIPFSYPELAGVVPGFQIGASDDDIFIANILQSNGKHAVRHWMKADSDFYGVHPTNGGAAWRDCATGHLFYMEPGLSIVQGTGINGQPTIELDGTQAFLPEGTTTVENQTHFTFISVFKPVAAAAGNRFILGPNTGSATGIGAPSVYLTATGVSTRIGGDLGLSAAGSDYLTGNAKVIAVTLSPENGTSIRRNGVEVARDQARTSPLLYSVMRIFGQPGVNNRAVGSAGDHFIFSVDMSSTQYLSKMDKLESMLMEKYGISKGS